MSAQPTDVVPLTRLVLFDLDGTLVDSTPGIWASVSAAAAAIGLPEPTSAQLRAMVGPPLPDGFATVFGLEGDDVQHAVSAYRTHYTAGAMLRVSVFGGVPELLALLRSRGATLAVASSKPEKYVGQVLEHVGLHDAFDSVHGATLDGRVRHKEQVIAAALTAHPRASRPALIGDHPHDILGARAHGLPCVGVGWGSTPPGELLAAGAAAVVSAPSEIPPTLSRLA